MMPEQKSTQQIDDLCDAFEAAWQSGQQPEVAEWLQKIDLSLRDKLLPPLIRVDLEYRLRTGASNLSLSDYVKSFGVSPDDISLLKKSGSTNGPDPNAETLFFEPNKIGNPQNFAASLPADRLRRFGEYEILEEIGRGGMGVVYKARHCTLGRIVALKTILAAWVHAPDVAARFRAEAEAVAQLDHPGIIPIFEVGADDGVPWFAMGYVDGQTLREQLREKPLECREAASIVLQIAQALQYAHGKGVIHRDVKPSNVMMDADGTARLTDFGLAKLQSRDETLTGTGEVLGTAAYMPPEQATGESLTASVTADVYSVGALLYCCLTGRPPFQAATSVEILRQVIEVDPVSPKRLNPAVDADLDVICLKCLQKELGRRFSSAQELADELQRYLNREPIFSRPVSRAARLSRWCRRRPFVAASILLTALLFFVLTIAVPYSLLQRSEREQAEQLAEANAARAATQEYYAAVQNVREERLVKSPGWTWRAIDSLKKSAASPADGKDPKVLRSLMTSALMAPDVRVVANFAEGVDTSDVASSRDGRYVALCETRGPTSVSVFVYQIDYNDKIQPKVTLFREFSHVLEQHPSGKPDGFRSICFSNDSTTIAAGTRHGDILEWQLDGRDAGQPIRRFTSDDYTVYQLNYSPDDTLLISASERPEEIRVWDRQSEICRHTFPHLKRSFAVNRDGELLFSQDDRAAYAKAYSADSLRQVEWPNIGTGIADVNTSSDGTIIASTEGHGSFHRTYLRDVDEGQSTIELLRRESEFRANSKAWFCAKKRFFATGNGVVCASVTPGRLRVWDALSGTIAFDYAVSDREDPPTTYIDSSNHVCVSGHGRSELLQLRRATALGSVAERSNTESSSDCIQIFAPSAWQIADFDLNEAGTEITILEGTDGDKDQRRVRTFDITTGREINRWTTRNLSGVNFHHNTPRQGLRISCAGVHATLAGPGFPFLLSDDGFAPIQGLEMPVVQAAPTRDPAGEIVWEFPSGFPEAADLPYVQVSVALRFPRPFPQDGESLEFHFECGPEEEHCRVDSTKYRPIFDDWVLLRIKFLPTAIKQRHGLSLRLVVNSDDHAVRIAKQVHDTDILIGSAFLFATPRPSGRRYQHGIASVQGDGTTFFVDDDLRLLKWNGEQQLPKLAWQDPDDTWVHIRDLDSGRSSTVFGTRKGDVFLANAGDELQLLHRALRSASNGDTKDDIQCVAMTPDASMAIAGNVDGELLLFDPGGDKHSLIGRQQMHKTDVSRLAITDDAKLIATADPNRNLRLWQRRDGELNLLLDLEHLDNPVHRIQFSPTADRLFVLCQNERGLRILNLKTLRRVFAESGIDWTDH